MVKKFTIEDHLFITGIDEMKFSRYSLDPSVNIFNVIVGSGCRITVNEVARAHFVIFISESKNVYCAKNRFGGIGTNDYIEDYIKEINNKNDALLHIKNPYNVVRLYCKAMLKGLI